MKIIPLLMCAIISLAGCATFPSPISVSRSAPPGSIDPSVAVMVVPEPGEVDWAAEQALRATGQSIQPSSTWRLRVSERDVLRVYPDVAGLGCRHHHVPWHGHWRSSEWYLDPWCDRNDRVSITRTVTWILEDDSGGVWWQASARESTSAGPPMKASLRLAQALAAWRYPAQH